MWVKDKSQRLQYSTFVWKVMMPEVYIKFYMSHFNLEKAVAEKNMRETPMSDREHCKLFGDSK